ncbi:DUF7678 domain-containing protein [Alkaliphilus serpentinus]|uniref:DUF7678 domain-containing protein n=1 Tax=Alkaliphilus serpentinus TaxID=1482731 RepID=A0A833M795_9FIRM|nr:hypothetical protein [Alkaliphilus serpentinus]KAB3529877.1 hypothetical protein F8153_08745 [Alkaliphilus serpentinus]
MSWSIKLSPGKNRYGYIKGEIDHFQWYALVHKDNVDYGIDPISLNEGTGRISRLCIYKDIPMSSYTKRLIYANYKRKWDVFNSSYEDMIRYLVEYLDRIYSIRLVK